MFFHLIKEDKFNNYLKEHNSKIKVVQGYGLSEGLAAVALCFDNVYKTGSIGIPLARNSIKIIEQQEKLFHMVKLGKYV